MAKIFNLFSLVFISFFVGSLAYRTSDEYNGAKISFEEYEMREYQKIFDTSVDAITLDNMFSMFTQFHNMTVRYESHTKRKINKLKSIITKNREYIHSQDGLILTYKMILEALGNKTQLFEKILIAKSELNSITSQIDKVDKILTERNSQYNENKKNEDDFISKIQRNDQEISELTLGQVNKSEIYKLEIRQLETKLHSCTSCCKAKSCKAFGNSTDIHVIHVNEQTGAFNVSCNGQVAEAGPGWTVIQRRIDGSENFYRNWSDYKMGFGNLSGEFFIGLEKLHHMTGAERQELFIQIEDFNNETKFARYDDFKVGSEDTFYKLISLGEYSGNAEDALQGDVDQGFSTFDRGSSSDKAILRYSAWWYEESNSVSNLNGRYMRQGERILDYKDTGIFWFSSEWHDLDYSFKSVQMMIRPKSDDQN